jgi:hypothetical protein
VPREQKSGVKTADVCRKHGISETTFYKRMARPVCKAFSRSGLVILLQRTRPTGTNWDEFRSLR